jgi:hypothetical protein
VPRNHSSTALPSSATSSASCSSLIPSAHAGSAATAEPRTQIYVIPDPNGTYRVTDGPSLAFTRADALTLAEAETEADRIANAARGADVMIIDSNDPNDLPDWAIQPRK